MKRTIRTLIIVVCLLALAAQPALAAETAAEPMTAAEAAAYEAAADVSLVPGDEPGMLRATIAGLPEDTPFVMCTICCETDDTDNRLAVKQEDGTWQVRISSADHGYRVGEYRLVAWTAAADGTRRILGTARTQLQYAGGTLLAQPADEAETEISLRLEGAQLPPDSPVWFRVYSEQRQGASQIGLGRVQADGTYLGRVSSARLGFTGVYRAEAYVGQSLLASTETVLSGCSSAAVQAEMADAAAGVFRIRAEAQAPAGIQRMRAAVWSAPDQSDLVWYEMDHSDDAWTVASSVAAHGHHFGTYSVHVYADLGNGLQTPVAQTTCTFAPDRYLYIENPAEGEYIVVMLGTGFAPGTSVHLPTWSAENGQDDICWYEAVTDEDGAVRCPVDFSLHAASEPAFVTHAYQDGVYLGAISYEVDEAALCASPAEQQLRRERRAVYAEVGHDLYSTYLWTVKNITYVPRPWQAHVPAGYTREQWFALEGFQTHRGDCFVYAATFAELARGLGYNAEYVEGYVWSVRGLWADHGFVVIHQDGVDYVCDPELESVSSKPRNLFMQRTDRTSAKYKW